MNHFGSTTDVLPRAMSAVLTGETTRTLDERYRLTLPAEMAEALVSDGVQTVDTTKPDSKAKGSAKGTSAKASSAKGPAKQPAASPVTTGDCLLAKERAGCLSLWNRAEWETKQDQATELVRNKLLSGRLDQRLTDVQRLGRLLSTRQRIVPLAGRGRLVVPEGFRELLGVQPGGSIIVVGAAVCVELWHPDAWATMIGEQMPNFRELFENLAN